MRLNKILFFSFLAIIGFTSCEDVIVLDLENDEPRLVIEAELNANTQTANVLLTMSNGFYDDISLNLVNDATVQITQSDGETVDLSRVADGFYTANGIEANDKDELSILVIDGNGKEYRASTTVPHNVMMDSLGIVDSERPSNPFGGGEEEAAYQIFTYWKDAANVESFYRVKAITNGVPLTNDYTLIDDFQAEGEQLVRPMFNTFAANDTVTVQLLSLDPASYKYLSDLAAQQSQGLNSTTPFNPQSNFDNNALGYFGIVRMDVQTVILP